MSTPQMPDRAALAELLIGFQPPSIARRLLDDADFRKALNVPRDRAVVYEGGPPIRKRTMYGVIRAVLEDGEAKRFPALDGKEIEVRLQDGRIFVSFSQEGTRRANIGLTAFLFLSTDPAVRLSAMDKLLDEIGPTSPDEVYWRARLTAAPLDDDAMEMFSDELEDSLAFCISRIQRDITNGYLDKTNLIPASTGYWERLCAPCRDGLSQEEWLKGEFTLHRHQLIARDLLRGLDLCLAMNISDELMPRHLVQHVSNDELWHSLESCAGLGFSTRFISIACCRMRYYRLLPRAPPMLEIEDLAVDLPRRAANAVLSLSPWYEPCRDAGRHEGRGQDVPTVGLFALYPGRSRGWVSVPTIF